MQWLLDELILCSVDLVVRSDFTLFRTDTIESKSFAIIFVRFYTINPYYVWCSLFTIDVEFNVVVTI